MIQKKGNKFGTPLSPLASKNDNILLIKREDFATPLVGFFLKKLERRIKVGDSLMHRPEGPRIGLAAAEATGGNTRKFPVFPGETWARAGN